MGKHSRPSHAGGDGSRVSHETTYATYFTFFESESKRGRASEGGTSKDISVNTFTGSPQDSRGPVGTRSRTGCLFPGSRSRVGHGDSSVEVRRDRGGATSPPQSTCPKNCGHGRRPTSRCTPTSSPVLSGPYPPVTSSTTSLSGLPPCPTASDLRDESPRAFEG